MRFESSVTSVSWIPSEAIRGLPRLPFDLGFGSYDDPPPDTVDDLDALAAAGAFRFANRLAAWIDVEDGSVIDHGYSGRSYISPTLMRFGSTRVAFQPHAMPDVRAQPEVGETWVRFAQSAGGRPGVPAPRYVRGTPFAQWIGPMVWTTLELTLHAGGEADGRLSGATPFPRHWVYDGAGRLVAKSGLIDFTGWYRTAFGQHTPWGEEDSPAFVTAAETALERELSTRIMRGGARPHLLRVAAGESLVQQGDAGTDLYLVLDGVLAVLVDGEEVAEVGPGAVLGERAALEGGRRTSTLRARTDCRVARAAPRDIDDAVLLELSHGHRREGT